MEVRFYTRTFIGILFLILICVGSVQAQFRWGAHAGANVSSLNYSNERSSVYSTTGLVAGVTLQYWMSKVFSVYAALQYAMKGGKIFLKTGYHLSLDDPLKMTTVILEYHYIEIPFGARILLLEEGIKPYLFGGFGLAALLSAKSIPQGADGLELGVWDDDVREYMRSTDALFHIGMGLECDIANGVALTADIRYSCSMVSLWDSDTSEDVNRDYAAGTLRTRDLMVIVSVLW